MAENRILPVLSSEAAPAYTDACKSDPEKHIRAPLEHMQDEAQRQSQSQPQSQPDTHTCPTSQLADSGCNNISGSQTNNALDIEGTAGTQQPAAVTHTHCAKCDTLAVEKERSSKTFFRWCGALLMFACVTIVAIVVVVMHYTLKMKKMRMEGKRAGN